MANCFSDCRIPKSDDRNSAAIAAFYRLSHHVGLFEALLKLEDVVFAPVNACALVSPHLTGFARGPAIKAMILRNRGVDFEIGCSGIFIFSAGECKVGKVVENLDMQRGLDILRFMRISRDVNTLAGPKLSRSFIDGCVIQIKGEVNRLAVL